MGMNNEPIGLESFEGLFTLPPGGGNKVTTEQAKALDAAGAFLDPETDRPLYSAPVDFYQDRAKHNLTAGLWDKAVTHMDAFDELFSPISRPIVSSITDPIKDIFDYGFWVDKDEAEQQKQDFLEDITWSEQTTDALQGLFTGRLGYGEAVEQIAGDFQDRPFAEQLAMSFANPASLGKFKLGVTGGKALLAGLPFAIGKTGDLVPTANKLKNFAKNPKLNLELNSLASVGKVPKQTFKKWRESTRLGIEERIIDKFAYANKVTYRLKNEWRHMFGEEIPDALNVEMHFANMSGLGGRVRYIGHEVFDKMHKRLDGTSRVFVDQFLKYKDLHAKHIAHPDRALPPGINTIDDFQGKIDEIQTELGAEGFGKVVGAAQVIRDEYKRLLDELVDEGMVAKDLAEKLTKMYPWYNPIQYADDIAEVATGLRGTTASGRKALRYLSEKGNVEGLEQLPATDVFLTQLSRLEFMLARNRANRAFVNALDMIGEPVEVLKGKNVPVAVRKVFDQIESAWTEEKIFRTQQIDLSKISKPVISFLDEGGKLKAFQVSPEAARSADMVRLIGNAGGPEGIRRTLAFVQAPFRAAYVTASPGFLVRQIVNDMISVAVTEGTMPHRSAAAMYSVLSDVIKNDPRLGELLKAGGDVQGYAGADPSRLLNEMLGGTKNADSVLEITDNNFNRMFNPLHWFGNLRRMAHNTELAPRLAVFNKALDEGLSPEAAAFRARTSTVDFQRMGTWGAWINTAYMFSNVAKEGAMLIPRAIKRRPKVALMGIGGYGILSMAAYLQNRQFPEYSHLDFTERAKVGLMIPSTEYKDGRKVPHYIAISPLARELAAISAPITYLMEQLDARLPEAYRAQGIVPARYGDLGETLINAYNPMNSILGTGADKIFGGVSQVIPTELGRLIGELNSNHDAYFDRPITPDKYINLPESEQHDDYTSEIAIRIAPYIPGLNPFQIDHIAKTGEFSQLVLAADAVIRQFVMDEDVEADAYYEQLQEMYEYGDPNTHRSIRRKFLSAFPKEMQDRILKIERQKPRSFPEKIPFVSKIIDGFYRKRGGALYEEGILKAEGVTGMSAEQTAQVSRKIGQFWGDFAKQRSDRYDEDLQAWIENPFRKDVATLSPNQWLGQQDYLSVGYHMMLGMLGQEFPEAAQLQDPETWRKWQESVHTVGGQLPDSRSVTQINATLLKAVPIFSIISDEEETMSGEDKEEPLVKDWSKFFQYRDMVAQGIIDAHGKQALADAEEEVILSLSPMQKKKKADFEFIRPYWDVVDFAIETMTPDYPNLKEEYEEYRKLAGDAALFKKESSAGLTELLNSRISMAREMILRAEIVFENDKWIVPGKDLSKSESESYWSSDLAKRRDLVAQELERTLIFWEIRRKALENGLNVEWDVARINRLQQQDAEAKQRFQGR